MSSLRTTNEPTATFHSNRLGKVTIPGASRPAHQRQEGGILIARNGDAFQIIAVASTRDEALELAFDYQVWAPEADGLCPEYFEIHRQRQNGYTDIERIEL